MIDNTETLRKCEKCGKDFVSTGNRFCSVSCKASYAAGVRNSHKWHHSEETKRKISLRAIGRKLSDGQKLKLSLTRRNKKLSKITRMKMRESASWTKDKYEHSLCGFKGHFRKNKRGTFHCPHCRSIVNIQNMSPYTEILPLCSCGCGEYVTKINNKFIHGHNVKICNPGFQKGKSSWNQGLTKEIDSRLVEVSAKQRLRMLETGGPMKEQSTVKKMVETMYKHYPNWSEKQVLVALEVCRKRWTNQEEVEKQRKLMKEKNPMFNPEYVVKVIQGAHKRPTGIENQFIVIYKKYGLPYKYTGDGSYLVGNHNPDFIATNGLSKAIDLFGSHWHSVDNGVVREIYFKEHGYELLILWEWELFNVDKVLAKVNEFTIGNINIESDFVLEFLLHEGYLEFTNGLYTITEKGLQFVKEV